MITRYAVIDPLALIMKIWKSQTLFFSQHCYCLDHAYGAYMLIDISHRIIMIGTSWYLLTEILESVYNTCIVSYRLWERY